MKFLNMCSFTYFIEMYRMHTYYTNTNRALPLALKQRPLQLRLLQLPRVRLEQRPQQLRVLQLPQKQRPLLLIAPQLPQAQLKRRQLLLIVPQRQRPRLLLIKNLILMATPQVRMELTLTKTW